MDGVFHANSIELLFIAIANGCVGGCGKSFRSIR